MNISGHHGASTTRASSGSLSFEATPVTGIGSLGKGGERILGLKTILEWGELQYDEDRLFRDAC